MSLRSHLCSCIFYQCPHLSTEDSGQGTKEALLVGKESWALPESCGIRHQSILSLWAGAREPGSLSVACYSAWPWRLSQGEVSLAGCSLEACFCLQGSSLASVPEPPITSLPCMSSPLLLSFLCREREREPPGNMRHQALNKVEWWLLGLGGGENGKLFHSHRVLVLQDENILESYCTIMWIYSHY